MLRLRTTTSIHKLKIWQGGLLTKTKRCSSTKKPPSPSNQAPEINFDPSQGNTILHQKAARAAELHAELNALLDKQAKRRAEEANRPFGAGFLEFMRKSKSEMINIFAAFTCVLLAWQISNIRKAARLLLEEAGEKEKRIEKLKNVLRVLSNEEFSAKVVKAYQAQLENSKLLDLENKGKRWFFIGPNRKLEEEGSSVSQQNEKSLLKSVLQNELSKTIGDLSLTDYELEDKKLETLQKELGMIEKLDNVNSGSNEASLNGLEKVLVEVQQEDNSADSSSKIVKRRGFI